MRRAYRTHQKFIGRYRRIEICRYNINRAYGTLILIAQVGFIR
jgi:hypothetical protein